MWKHIDTQGSREGVECRRPQTTSETIPPSLDVATVFLQAHRHSPLPITSTMIDDNSSSHPHTQYPSHGSAPVGSCYNCNDPTACSAAGRDVFPGHISPQHTSASGLTPPSPTSTTPESVRGSDCVSRDEYEDALRRARQAEADCASKTAELSKCKTRFLASMLDTEGACTKRIHQLWDFLPQGRQAQIGRGLLESDLSSSFATVKQELLDDLSGIKH